MAGEWKQRLPVVVLLAAIPVVIWACRRPVALECPDHDVRIRSARDTTLFVTEVPLAGPLTNIVEFHDCQRLISLSDGRAYGPLVGIWVSRALDRLPDSLGQVNPAIPASAGLSKLAASDTISDLGPAVPSAAGTGLAFVEIYAWDDGYRPLGIDRGWNCLYLFPAGSGRRYVARMVPTEDENSCLIPAGADTIGGTPLNVFPVTMPGLGPKDYPMVGRWEWNRRKGAEHQYIGIGCGTSWCEITDQTMRPDSPRHSIGSTPGAAERRVWEVAGWYDEQQLAVSGTGNVLVPAHFKGTAIPDPGLDTLENTEAFDGKWVPVAEVSLEAESPAYVSKLNFHRGALPSGTPARSTTRVYMCMHRCDFSDGAAPACKHPPEGEPWWAKIVSRGSVQYRCVTRTPHEGMGHLPGTARWRWMNKDETLWVRCTQGCCQVN